eukprot:scaffold246037_cov27-Tisochrysis_lutea.AAC.1
MINRYDTVGPFWRGSSSTTNTRRTAWLSKQSRDTKDKEAEVKRIIRNEGVTEAVRLCPVVCSPIMRVLRMTDTRLGATLGTVYAYMLQLDVHLHNPISRLHGRMQKKIHRAHSPVTDSF